MEGLAESNYLLGIIKKRENEKRVNSFGRGSSVKEAMWSSDKSLNLTHAKSEGLALMNTSACESSHQMQEKEYFRHSL